MGQSRLCPRPLSPHILQKLQPQGPKTEAQPCPALGVLRPPPQPSPPSTSDSSVSASQGTGVLGSMRQCAPWGPRQTM